MQYRPHHYECIMCGKGVADCECIPVPPTPRLAEVKQYMADVRFCRVHWKTADEYYAWRHDLQKQIERLRQEQSWRYAKTRATKLEKLEHKLYYDKAHDVQANIYHDYSAACERLSSFRQKFYGYCWDSKAKSRRHFRHNWLRSYGRIVVDDEPVTVE